MIEQYVLVTAKEGHETTPQEIEDLFSEFAIGFEEKGDRKYADGVESVCMGRFNANQVRALFARDATISREYDELKKHSSIPFMARVRVNNDFTWEKFRDVSDRNSNFDFRRYDLEND